MWRRNKIFHENLQNGGEGWGVWRRLKNVHWEEEKKEREGIEKRKEEREGIEKRKEERENWKKKKKKGKKKKGEEEEREEKEKRTKREAEEGLDGFIYKLKSKIVVFGHT